MNECWNCGQPGIPWPPGVELTQRIRRICLRCDVMWMSRNMVPGTVQTEMLWMGKAVPVVDFTRPGALSCPA